MGTTRSYLLFAASGPVLVLTEYDFAHNPALLEKLAKKTSDKFVAFEVDSESIKVQYRDHFDHIMTDPKQGEIKILDSDGERIFQNVGFKQLMNPIVRDV
jgi:hypothetical protein